MSKWRQGIFTPKNSHKFIGSRAVYRSGLELKFFRFCDSNDNILKWGSENIIVPYISPIDMKTHRYYVDNFVVIREGANITRYLIEIKPSKQTQPPTTKYRKKQHLIYEQRLWVINQAKWQAAREYSRKKGWKFLIMTEKDLYTK